MSKHTKGKAADIHVHCVVVLHSGQILLRRLAAASLEEVLAKMQALLRDADVKNSDLLNCELFDEKGMPLLSPIEEDPLKRLTTAPIEQRYTLECFQHGATKKTCAIRACSECSAKRQVATKLAELGIKGKVHWRLSYAFGTHKAGIEIAASFQESP